ECLGSGQRSAECNSAKQQITNLRYAKHIRMEKGSGVWTFRLIVPNPSDGANSLTSLDPSPSPPSDGGEHTGPTAIASYFRRIRLPLLYQMEERDGERRLARCL